MTRGKLPRSLGISRGRVLRPPPRPVICSLANNASLCCPEAACSAGQTQRLTLIRLMATAHLPPSVPFSPRASTGTRRKALIQDPTVPLSRLLKEYDISAGVHRSKLLGFLHHPSDPESIIALMPSLIQALCEPEEAARAGGSESKVKYDRRLFRFLIPHLGKYKMFALLPTVTDLFIQRWDLEWDKWKQAGTLSEKSSNTIQSWYDSYFQSLGHFIDAPTLAQKKIRHLSSESAEPLPLSVRNEVTRMVKHLLDLSSEIPSSSDLSSQPTLSTEIIDRLITRQYLTPGLTEILARHALSHNIDLTPDQWHQLTLCAIEAGNHKAVKEYVSQRAQAVKRLATSIEQGEQGPVVRSIDRKKEKQLQRRRVAAKISEMIVAQARTLKGQTIEELLETLEPYFYTTDESDVDVDDEDAGFSAFLPKTYDRSLLRYTWSILLHRSSKDHRLSMDTLLEITNALPGDAVIGHTLTPVMHGLIRRGEPLKAWEIWRGLLEKEKLAPSEYRGLFVDKVALAVATEACYGATNLDAAITLVDVWARKPFAVDTPSANITSAPSTNTNNRKGVRLKTKAKPSAGGEHLAGSIPLDTQNLNVLLNMCKNDGKARIAFRLWAAAIPRYGVYHDDISLNLMLDIARYSDPDYMEDEAVSTTTSSSGSSGQGTGAEIVEGRDGDLFRRRLRAMAAEFRFGGSRSKSDSKRLEGEMESRTHSGATVEWAHGPTAVLLDHADPEGYPLRRSRHVELPWEKARRIFRQVILGNWPHLAQVRSPLEVGNGAFESIVSFFGSGSASASASTLNLTNGQGVPSITSNRIRNSASSSSLEISQYRIPSPTAKYTHIIPTTSTFRFYIGLLGYYNLHAEIPIALAWMKGLSIKPDFTTMCLALLHICENEGPRRWVKGWAKDGVGVGLVRDEQIMRRWLEEWLDPDHNQQQNENPPLSEEDRSEASPNEAEMHDGQSGNTGANTDEEKNKKKRSRQRQSIVPTEEDVARSRRWFAERRRRIHA